MDQFHIDDLLDQQADTDDPFFEFLRKTSLSMGLYRLPAGATDPQNPHTEDEVYYIVSGAAMIQVGKETRPVRPGDVVFVEKLVDHRFFDIEEDLEILVFFAPAEGTLDDS